MRYAPVPQPPNVTPTSSKIRRSVRAASPRSRLGAVLVIAASGLAVALATPSRADARGESVSRASAGSAAPTAEILASNATRTASLELIDSLRGRSRKLRARFLAPKRASTIPVLRELFGDSSISKPGVYVAKDVDPSSSFHFITMRPFTDKVAGRIGTYRIGFFPEERRGARTGSYVNPEGFLEVTAENQNTNVSEHFRLRDFLTHDQVRVWPKYLVLREPLIDKLELVIAELKDMGVRVNGMRVMSGFRTPQYNQQGVGAGGRVQDSRHQFGDAADVYIVNGSNDWMSDLNADGRVDTRDAKVLAMAAERVEQKHPDLVGGVGIYKATSAHGPFVHIDVRGTRARWGE